MMKKVEEVVGHGRREGLELHEGSDGLEEAVIEARVGRTAGPGIPWEERFEVERNYHGWRIDRYLAEKMHRASRAQAANIVRHGLWLDERWVTKQGATVRAGQLIRIPRLEFADPATPSLVEVTVLHDDGAAIVLNKPPGMLIHRTANESTRTVEAYVTRQWPDDRVEAAHRLDRETAGCVACGRGFDAIRDLRMRFAESAAEKRYRAIVQDDAGRWQTGSRATIDTPLGMMGTSVVSIKMDVGPLPCRTHVVCIERRGSHALLEVEIEQGRQHQIRAHLWLQGTPIVGDKLYALGDDFFLAWINAPGAPELVEQLPIRWHALACVGLQFEHAGGSVAVTAPTPPHMAEFWAELQP
jgi:23S rRNA pseudouridine1911/1915/1917 synthase